MQRQVIVTALIAAALGFGLGRTVLLSGATPASGSTPPSPHQASDSPAPTRTAADYQIEDLRRQIDGWRVKYDALLREFSKSAMTTASTGATAKREAAARAEAPSPKEQTEEKADDEDGITKDGHRYLRYQAFRPYRPYRAYRRFQDKGEIGSRHDCDRTPFLEICRGTQVHCKNDDASPECRGTQAHCEKHPRALECAGTEAYCKVQPNHQNCAGTVLWCLTSRHPLECAGAKEICHHDPRSDLCIGTAENCHRDVTNNPLCQTDGT